MEKSDYLFLSNQQKNLQANNPDGVRNWSGTVMLLRPKPFGVQSVNQVRAFNHKAFKVVRENGFFLFNFFDVF